MKFLAFLAAGASAHTLTVNVHYPDSSLKGDALTLRGSAAGLDWDKGVAMDGSSDLWTAEVEFTAAEAGSELEFKPLVDDDTWAQGANFKVTLPAGDASVDAYPWFYTTQGRFEITKELCSETLGNCRKLRVYVPPSFDENPLKSYDNVLLMHDAENLFDPSTSFGGVAWMCQDTVDELLQAQAIDELVIVGADNTMSRTDEYTYSVDEADDDDYVHGAGGEGDKYLDFLEQQVLPFAQEPYRLTLKSVGIGGSSLGGLISAYAGWTRADVYDKAIAMSSSFWWNGKDFNSTVIPSVDPAPVGKVQIYLDSGSPQDDTLNTVEIRNDMEDAGFTLDEDLFYYLDQGGQHAEYYWGQRFWIPISDLYPVTSLPVSS